MNKFHASNEISYSYSFNYSKKYNGVVGFETVSGNKIETVFNA